MLEKFYQIRKETITDSELTAEKYHNFFTDIGPKLAKEIETPAESFKFYLRKLDLLQPEYPLKVNKSKEGFFSLQTNKSPGHDEISC